MEKNTNKSLFRKYGVINIVLLIILLSVSETTNAQSKNLDVVDEFDLTKEELDAFKITTVNKVQELENCISIIGSKSQAEDNRNKAINAALKLFIPDAKMQVSVLKSRKTTVNTYSMRTYLYRLKSLPYSKVEITFYDLAYISDFQPGADGKYYATAVIFQEFKGFTGDNISYTDSTKKTIDVVVELREDPFFKVKRWTILLGDIKVTETRQG